MPLVRRVQPPAPSDGAPAAAPPEWAMNLQHYDLTDAVREAFESGCECDTCNIVRALARTNEMQHRRFTWLRLAAYIGAIAGTLSVILILLDLLFLTNP